MKEGILGEFRARDWIYYRSCKVGLEAALREIETAVICEAIKRKKRFDLAAQELGIKRTTFVMKRKRLGLLK